MTLPTETMEERFEKFIENESMIDIRIAREFLPFIRQELSLSQNRILEEVKRLKEELLEHTMGRPSEFELGKLRQLEDIIKLISKKDNQSTLTKGN